MKILKYYIIVVVFISSYPILGQNKIYKELYNFSTKTSPLNSAPDRIVYSLNNDTLYFTGASYYDKQKIRIITYNIKSGKIGNILIKKSNDNKQLFKHPIVDLKFIKNKLVILNYLSIYIFIKEGNVDFKLQKIIKNEGSFTKIIPLTQDQLLFYVNYQFHPLDETELHTWAKLYINSDSLGTEKRMDDNNVVFSPMLNSWISVYKGMIAYAQTTDYTIRFYDENFNLFDSIKSNSLDKNKDYLELIPDGKSYSLDEINRTQEADDSLLTRIQKVFLLDSTHLLLTLKQPKTHHLLYDIWEKKNLTWTKIKSEDLPGHYEDKSKYTKENNSITGFYGGLTGLSYAGNNEFYFIYFPFIENPISSSFDYQKDYYDIVNEMTRQNKLYYGIKKLKIITK